MILSFVHLMKIIVLTLALSCVSLHAQQKPGKKKQPPFRWNNLLPAKYEKERVKHGTFESKLNKAAVGYNILLPEVYEIEKDQRFPVVYLLHGGRPGSESKLLRMAGFVNEAIEKEIIPPTIYVFVNGGPVSHYDYPTPIRSLGKEVGTKGNSAFAKELIPHIDQTYRTIARRKGRILEGYSQGGRGTLRTAFRYPEIFVAASAGSAGLATELRISREAGKESEDRQFSPGDDAYTLARKYVEKKEERPIKLLLYSGDTSKDFNWEGNVAYSKYLKALGIKHRHLLIPGCGHSSYEAYTISGEELFKFLAPVLKAASK